MVTAAVTAIAPTPQRAEAADRSDAILSVPQTDPVSDESAIPVRVRLSANWLKTKVDAFAKVTSMVVTLSNSDAIPAVFKPFAASTFLNHALVGAKAKGGIEFTKRLKQMVDAKKPPMELKLKATIKINADAKDRRARRLPTCERQPAPPLRPTDACRDR